MDKKKIITEVKFVAITYFISWGVGYVMGGVGFIEYLSERNIRVDYVSLQWFILLITRTIFPGLLIIRYFILFGLWSKKRKKNGK